MGTQKIRIVTTFILILFVISTISGAVYAYLSATTDSSVNNVMTASPSHTIQIQETFATNADNNLLKSNVSVNVGDPGYAVYVRVAIVATWKDENENVYWDMPTNGTDFQMELNDSDWFQGSDSYYYLKSMFIGTDENKGCTPVLIKSCQQIAMPPLDGYQLHIEIIAQTIQALGSTDENDIPAVTDAWEIEVDSNKNLINPGNSGT